MEQVVNFIESLKAVDIIDIIVAICLIILFKVLSPSISYMIIKIFKFNSKSKKSIKESAFYTPLKIFFTILGVYIAVVFLKKPLNLPDNVMEIVTKAFQIISVLAFAKALASSFTTKSKLLFKMKSIMLSVTPSVMTLHISIKPVRDTNLNRLVLSILILKGCTEN